MYDRIGFATHVSQVLYTHVVGLSFHDGMTVNELIERALWSWCRERAENIDDSFLCNDLDEAYNELSQFWGKTDSTEMDRQMMTRMKLR